MFADRPAAALAALVAACARHAWATLGLVALALAVALGWIGQNFAMTTDTGALISAHTGWRQDEAAVEQRFPALKDAIVVVIDGATSEAASDAANRLAAMLARQPQVVARVSQSDGGDFLAREGLLLRPRRVVLATTQRLIAAQPLLGPLAADPSLRGVAGAIATAAEGAGRDPGTGAQLVAPFTKLAAAIDAGLGGRRAFFSWAALFAGDGEAPPTRQVLLVQPRLRFDALEPGAAATEAIRADARALGIDAAHGQHLALTGAVPLADEEFGSIHDNIGLIGAGMVAAMALCLWFATRSVKMVVAIIATTLAGLILTLALGLVMVGRLNLISVAFIPLFVGLGVDFGIQVSVRFNAERYGEPEVTRQAALARAARGIGAPLLLAAGAISLALVAFLPTDYIGIAELGVIAAMGMVVALALNVTLLPALIVRLAPSMPARAVGWAPAARVDRWLARRRRWVLAGFVLACAGSIALLPRVVFDFNPMHLRDPATPAMRALAELARDPDRTPDVITMLAPNLAAADRLAAAAARLPEVDHALTLDSFVPDDQPAKLAAIGDAALLLDAAINPFAPPAPADDAATISALTQAASRLHALAATAPVPLRAAASHLAASFAKLAAAPPEARAQASTMLVTPLDITLESLRNLLAAAPVSRASLPADLRADWLARDGTALVLVTPKLAQPGISDNAALRRFTAAMLRLSPHATGLPIATQAAANTVTDAFIRAGWLALALVSALLWLALRSIREVAFTLAPVVLSGFLTLGTCVIIGQPLNFANIIAFPLLFGVGVAFHIYFVMAWRHGISDLLQTPLARAVAMSALATGSAFGALVFSHHPGTASMGLILMIALVWTLVCALVFEPALLGPAHKPESVSAREAGT